MKRKRLVLPSILGPIVCTGCATMPFGAPGSAKTSVAQVTVRFTAPIPALHFADASGEEADALSEDALDGASPRDRVTMSSSITPDTGPYHAVLWGGRFDGDDVTYTPAPLSKGQYMFGLFDSDRDAVYQGWISVNNGGNDVLSLLTEWRDTIREQKHWLAFENKIEGKFASRDMEHYKDFRKELRDIDRLEKRLDKAVRQEMDSRRRNEKDQASFVGGVEVSLFPGITEFSHPVTLPTFSNTELAGLHNGEAHTKVILVADHDAANEKLRRLNNLRADLKRYQEVLSEEVSRLEKRKRYYLLTDHIYNHDEEFVTNERRLQQVRGMLQRTGEKVDEHRRHCLALMFVRGLFSPDETLDAFEEEESSLRRDRVVLEARQRQVDMRISDLDERSGRRVALQRSRQDILAAVDQVNREIDRLSDARDTLADLRDATRIIHRHGPARMITAAMFDQKVPGYIASAIEHESLMTVRLQATDQLQAPPPACELAVGNRREVMRTDYR